MFGAVTLGLARAAGETMAVTMVIGITTQINVSPFQPAQTMSSLLAVNFGEVTDGLEKSALVEVALILLVMSLLFNLIARYLVVGKTAPRWRRGRNDGLTANTTSAQSLFPTSQSRHGARSAFCLTAMILGLLLIITADIVSNGIRGLTPAFFTHTPDDTPPGILNGITGTAILLLLASIVGIPVGMLSGIYLSEYDQGSKLASPLRFVCDLLAGRAEHCRRRTRVPTAGDSVRSQQRLGRGAGAGVHHGADHCGGRPRRCCGWWPQSYREASIALGATKAGTILNVVIPSAAGSVATGVMLAIARVAGETAPLIFTAGLVSRMETSPSNTFSVDHRPGVGLPQQSRSGGSIARLGGDSGADRTHFRIESGDSVCDSSEKIARAVEDQRQHSKADGDGFTTPSRF